MVNLGSHVHSLQGDTIPKPCKFVSHPQSPEWPQPTPCTWGHTSKISRVNPHQTMHLGPMFTVCRVTFSQILYLGSRSYSPLADPSQTLYLEWHAHSLQGDPFPSPATGLTIPQSPRWPPPDYWGHISTFSRVTTPVPVHGVTYPQSPGWHSSPDPEPRVTHPQFTGWHPARPWNWGHMSKVSRVTASSRPEPGVVHPPSSWWTCSIHPATGITRPQPPGWPHTQDHVCGFTHPQSPGWPHHPDPAHRGSCPMSPGWHPSQTLNLESHVLSLWRDNTSECLHLRSNFHSLQDHPLPDLVSADTHPVSRVTPHSRPFSWGHTSSLYGETLPQALYLGSHIHSLKGDTPPHTLYQWLHVQSPGWSHPQDPVPGFTSPHSRVTPTSQTPHLGSHVHSLQVDPTFQYCTWAHTSIVSSMNPPPRPSIGVGHMSTVSKVNPCPRTCTWVAVTTDHAEIQRIIIDSYEQL